MAFRGGIRNDGFFIKVRVSIRLSSFNFLCIFRIYLEYHTIAQVMAGLVVGTAIAKFYRELIEKHILMPIIYRIPTLRRALKYGKWIDSEEMEWMEWEYAKFHGISAAKNQKIK